MFTRIHCTGLLERLTDGEGRRIPRLKVYRKIVELTERRGDVLTPSLQVDSMEATTGTLEKRKQSLGQTAAVPPGISCSARTNCYVHCLSPLPSPANGWA
eukprot:scaffold840_cov344-Pavlova_lutheri.AAC.80